MADTRLPLPGICPECGGKIDPTKGTCKWCGHSDAGSSKSASKIRKGFRILLTLVSISLLGAVPVVWFYLKFKSSSSHFVSSGQTAQDQQSILESARAIEQIRQSSPHPSALGIFDFGQVLKDKTAEFRCFDIPFQSTRIRIQITSLGNPMSVQFPVGTRIFNDQNGSELVTLNKEVIRLNAGATESRDLSVARLKTSGVHGDYRMEALPTDHPVALFLSKNTKELPSLPWNVLQISIWILTQNVDLDTVRAERYSISQKDNDGLLGATISVAETAAPIDGAFRLLEKSGLNIAKTHLYKDLEKTLALALTDYLHSPTDAQNLETLGFFRTRPESRSVLCEIFSRNDNPQGVDLRKKAYHYLTDAVVKNQTQDVGESQRLVEVLADAMQKETDGWLKQEMKLDFEKAKKALSRSLISKDES